MIRNATPADLKRIAACHGAAFPDTLSVALGEAYVVRMLSWYLSTDKTLLFFWEKEGRCAGYLGAMVSDGGLPTGSVSGMLQHSLDAARAALLRRPWLLLHPELRARYPLIVRNLAARWGLRSMPRPAPPSSPRMGVIAVGVDPSDQGEGIGKALLREFERRALHDYGIRELYLSVRPDNLKAIRYYERCGWQCAAPGQYVKYL